jgi:hypothetical protein
MRTAEDHRAYRLSRQMFPRQHRGSGRGGLDHSAAERRELRAASELRAAFDQRTTPNAMLAAMAHLIPDTTEDGWLIIWRQTRQARWTTDFDVVSAELAASKRAVNVLHVPGLVAS